MKLKVIQLIGGPKDGFELEVFTDVLPEEINADHGDLEAGIVSSKHKYMFNKVVYDGREVFQYTHEGII